MWATLIAVVLITAIIILLYLSCISPVEHLDQVRGYRIKGIGLASKMGYPTINLKLSEPLNCGIYTGKSDHGNVIILVGGVDSYRADCHFLNFNDRVDEQTEFILYDVRPLTDQGDEIISTYNRGCRA